MEILFPMTCNILTPGHIQCINFLKKKGFVTVGLLTKKALKGYKKEVTPFEDRKFILEALGCNVLPQESLDPTSLIKKYKFDAIASGDGWESSELKAIERLGIIPIDIKLSGEKSKKYASSKIYDIIRNQK